MHLSENILTTKLATSPRHVDADRWMLTGGNPQDNILEADAKETKTLCPPRTPSPESLPINSLNKKKAPYYFQSNRIFFQLERQKETLEHSRITR